MRRPTYRYQRTICQPAEVEGIGYVTGATVRLRFMPAPPSTGVVFVRTDIGPNARIPATVDRVTGTKRRTTLGHPPVSVGIVEHVLGALAGLRIDNCFVELNAPEPPGLDGSALAFVTALNAAGTVIQPARRSVWIVDRPILVQQKGATLAIHPHDEHGENADNELRVSFHLDYGRSSPIIQQRHSIVLTPEAFIREIAPCRTFLLEEEAHEIRRSGIGSNTTAKDLLVFGKYGPIDNALRFANEPARHKILDVIGDLSLFGQDIRGHVVACRSGHPLNVQLVHELMGQLPQARCMLRRAA